MRKVVLWGLLMVLALAGCGGGRESETTAAQTTGAGGTPSAGAETAQATATPAATATPEDTGLSILFINVGYGDAALIRVNGRAYMVDTGQKSAAPALYRALTLLGVDRLDGLFLTHTHSDHIGGAEALALRCEIGTLYSAEISMDKDSGKNAIEQVAQELSLTHQKLSAGDTVDIGGGAYFEVLGPVSYNGDDDNDNSLVMKLHAGGVTVLLTGDMQFAEESTLLAAGADLSADVLKVGNHGNPDATSEAFTQAVNPKYAVISTSTAEDDDTPNERVLALLSGAHVAVTQDYVSGVLLTAKDGAVTLSDMPVPEPAADVAIQEIDKDAQTITLVNRGAEKADLSRFFIWSMKGSEVFVFPQGAALAAGDTLTVACRGGSGDYLWDDKKVWSGKADEAGILYDAYGTELSRMS